MAQLPMLQFFMRINHYCFVFFMKNKRKNKKKKKTKKSETPYLLHVRHQVWHQFGSLWVRGVHLHPFKPHLTPSCPLTPLNLLKVPTKFPWFRNVSKALGVTPIWKPLGQGSSFAPFRTTFDNVQKKDAFLEGFPMWVSTPFLQLPIRCRRAQTVGEMS